MTSWLSSLLLAGLLAAPAAPAATTAEVLDSAAADRGPVHVLRLSGSINPGSADYIIQEVRNAELANAEALLLVLDTPGGMLEATRDIVKSMLGAAIPVIVYVAPGGARAGSAGVFITMAAHVAVMAPGSNIGAAHPVLSNGGDPESGGKHMAEKIENDTVAFIESIATQRERNIEWARSAVTASVSVTAEKALELDVIDFLASDVTDLLAKAEGRSIDIPGRTIVLQTKGKALVEREMSFAQKIVHFLAHPNISYILMMIGMLGIYFELSNPGLILPGVAGGVALILAFITFQVLPINTGGLLLIFAALVLFILEIYVTSFGLLAIAGIICFVVGSLLLFDSPGSDMQVDISIVVSSTISLTLFFAFVGYLILDAQKRQSFLGEESMVAMVAEADQDIAGRGQLFINGEIWSVVVEGAAQIHKGEGVEVTAVNGLTLTVRPLAKTDA